MPKVSEAQLEARRQEILFAAVACFARRGFRDTKMSDIAREAGISDGLAYRYFSNKDEIVAEVVRMGSASQGLPLTTDGVDDALSLVDMLYRSSSKRFEMEGRETTLRLRFRSWAEAINDEDARRQVSGRWDHHIEVAARAWERLQAEGRLDPDLDPRAVARIMLAVHDGLDAQWLLDGDVDVEACDKVVLRLAEGLLRDGSKSAADDAEGGSGGPAQQRR